MYVGGDNTIKLGIHEGDGRWRIHVNGSTRIDPEMEGTQIQSLQEFKKSLGSNIKNEKRLFTNLDLWLRHYCDVKNIPRPTVTIADFMK